MKQFKANIKHILELALINESMYEYVGNCVDSFDDDGQTDLPMFRDTTEFAQAEENAKEITKEQFEENVIISKEMMDKFNTNPLVKYLYSEDSDFYMIYDGNADIHYFFGKV